MWPSCSFAKLHGIFLAPSGPMLLRSSCPTQWVRFAFSLVTDKVEIYAGEKIAPALAGSKTCIPQTWYHTEGLYGVSCVFGCLARPVLP